MVMKILIHGVLFGEPLPASDSEKSRRITAIRKEGLEPVVRVVARNLTEHDALLVEKTLLWRLGRQLTNISSGHYADNFRPHNSMHKLLTGFDYRCGLYNYNTGEGPHRSWDDYQKFGFISAGQGIRWRDAMLGFNEGDVIAAYLKGHGFVGVGLLTSQAKPIRDVVLNGKALLSHGLSCKGMADNIDSNELCEYIALVKWIKVVDRSEAKWKSRSGIFTTQHVRASLDGQPNTVAFIDDAFSVDLKKLIV